MKKLLLITLTGLLACATLNGCKKDQVKEQEQATSFHPRIFNDTFLFPVPAVTAVLTVGQTRAYTGLIYSPANDVQITWKLDGTNVATTRDYTFTATTRGTFTVRLEVTYNGQTTFRTGKIQVN